MNDAAPQARQRLAEAWLGACRLDVAVRKPGNVSVHSPGHDMTAADFLKSAEVCVPHLLAEGCGVGARVLASVAATRDAVGCNTNLGILLLAAPICCAADRISQGAPSGPMSLGELEEGVRQTLSALGPEDARAVYAAIALASPGGLGDVPEASVHAPPPASLLLGMQLAAGRDRIAAEYVSGLAGIFGFGVAALKAGFARWGGVEAAVQWCYLRWLETTPDSHVARKYGPGAAKTLADEAGRVASHIKACENPADFERPLADFDTRLKARKVNPGTTADLTVASTLVWWLTGRG